jgi:bifunctional UDP-N-acetylglucosamine pyrophosphorylase/glucosamine-1-phosphate N-acetyltransferase
MATAAVILAAGMGTRMKSAKPKVMHAVAGLPILGHVVAAARGAGADRVVVVTAPAMHEVRAYAQSLGAENAIQDRQLGTGHAALCARQVLETFDGAILVNNGDMPLAEPAMMAESLRSAEAHGLSVVAFRPRDPAAYGRVILGADGMLDRIVEFKDASPAERAADLCCAGTYSAAQAQRFFAWASKLSNDNAQGEYYLPEVTLAAKADGVRAAVTIAGEVTVMGVNSRAELAAAEARMQERLRNRALDGGAGMTAPETVFLCHDTMLEPDCEIGPYVVFGPGVCVRSGAAIRSHCVIEGAEIREGAVVGPHARLRPGTVIGEGAHIGNFVEAKNSRIGAGAKANHLAYLGDATVGAGANIGAGTITCNYDGFDKHRTEIGAGAFIGSNSSLVAPVAISEGVYVGAGSVVTKPQARDSLVITRAEQKEIPGWAEKFRSRKKAGKTSKGK